jgi:hypothetical protein
MRVDPAGWPYQEPGGDDPDWTDGGDHPDWTSGDDGRPTDGATRGWPYGEDHPSWPAGEPTAYYDVGAGDDRVRFLPPSANEDWQPSTGAGTGAPPQITANGASGLLDSVRRDTGGFRGEDSVRLADQILSDAGSQAASVRQEAMEQANVIREAAEREAEEIRRQAAYEADAAREAGRKAGELKRQAAAQAAAMREAAEREADELRADAIRLGAELGEVAAYVTMTLNMPAIPAPERQPQPRRHVAEPFAIPAAPTAEPPAWAAAGPRSQARSGRYYTEDLDSEVMPGAGPEIWEQRRRLNGHG